MWVPVHDEEWDGDIPLGLNGPCENECGAKKDGAELEEGEVVFEKGTLPWQTGQYEIRYHHDGKYNVMDVDGPFEVYSASVLCAGLLHMNELKFFNSSS